MRKVIYTLALLFAISLHSYPDKTFTPCLYATSYEIQNTSLEDWWSSHSSYGMPLHTFSGTIAITNNSVQYSGRHSKTGALMNLEIPLKNIKDIYLGFDDIFTRTKDRQLTLEPLRITYTDATSNSDNTIYLYAGYRKKFWGYKVSENKILYDDLIKRIR